MVCIRMKPLRIAKNDMGWCWNQCDLKYLMGIGPKWFKITCEMNKTRSPFNALIIFVFGLLMPMLCLAFVEGKADGLGGSAAEPTAHITGFENTQHK
mmetsp:Transcript_88852/g.156808  ORF Transcript_88852/g.156808 Transcript_88852/m.156808 type:complete len:97 (+) Transcript_88852:464-754(+)